MELEFAEIVLKVQKSFAIETSITKVLFDF